jgi:hypothetical protein
MNKYRYIGTGPCWHNGQKLKCGDVIEWIKPPSTAFVLVEIEEKKPLKGRKKTMPQPQPEEDAPNSGSVTDEDIN